MRKSYIRASSSIKVGLRTKNCSTVAMIIATPILSTTSSYLVESKWNYQLDDPIVEFNSIQLLEPIDNIAGIVISNFSVSFKHFAYGRLMLKIGCTDLLSDTSRLSISHVCLSKNIFQQLSLSGNENNVAVQIVAWLSSKMAFSCSLQCLLSSSCFSTAIYSWHLNSSWSSFIFMVSFSASMCSRSACSKPSWRRRSGSFSLFHGDQILIISVVVDYYFLWLCSKVVTSHMGKKRVRTHSSKRGSNTGFTYVVTLKNGGSLETDDVSEMQSTAPAMLRMLVWCVVASPRQFSSGIGWQEGWERGLRRQREYHGNINLPRTKKAPLQRLVVASQAMKGARSHYRAAPCGLGERFMMSRLFSEGWVAVVRRSLSRHRRQLFVTVYDFFVIKITKKLVLGSPDT